ncbi:membrane protein insertase YidC [Nordella sp. HKS 07]|uniref:membrane protein insertase YidC n=1 Tax=Nordella sp. HKS 07 TaxID=2712222 RepID=UPI0013E12EBB|nr:membrane protein insertase YidC [Nordella sp. HKS 07]QIG49496.1 membrane protein insertase YidC [Nordella sp. HKS 07]
MQHDNKNFIIAIVLSMAIIFGWQYFYATPMQKKLEQQPPQQQTQVTGGQQQPGSSVPGSTEAQIVPRETAIAAGKRITIETPVIDGSINLIGAQFDDIRFKNYRETVDPKSPEIALLSPSGTPQGYFAEQGFVAATGTTANLPGPKTEWQAPADAVLAPGKPVTLTWDNGEGLVFTRTISVDEDYLFSIKQEVHNKTAEPISLFPYARIQRQGTPKVAGIYVLFEGLIGVLNGELDEIHYKDLKDETKKITKDGTGGWLGFTDKYWASALIPDQATGLAGTFQHITQGTSDVYQTDYLGKTAITIPAGGSAAYTDRLFAGAKVVQNINAIGEKYGVDRFDLMIDWGWFYFLTKPLFWLLEYIKGIVGNFGLAILIVTVIVKLLFFPLQNKSYESMSKMKKLQPEMEKIKQQNPDDRMKQQQEMMALYKREKVSPLSGCLPILIAIPVFFALYKVIYVTIEMRHAPFFGWIQDLSAPDPTSLFNLFGLLPFTPPHLLMVGVWPIIMGITMWLQMRLNPTPPDPIQAQLFNWMPLIFTFMLAAFPAGLVIYWAWNNFLSILQQSYIMRRQGVEVNFFGNIRDSLPFLKRKSSTG